jgi:hypothetical protein
MRRSFFLPDGGFGCPKNALLTAPAMLQFLQMWPETRAPESKGRGPAETEKPKGKRT